MFRSNLESRKRCYRSQPVGRAPKASSNRVRKSMRSNRSSGTTPEVLLSKLLRKKLISPRLPGRPDFTYPGARLVVFVHGCWWHRCPTCNIPLPETHRSYWRRKLERNVERDRFNKEELESLGWTSLEVWEHEVRHTPKLAVSKIRRVILSCNLAPR